MRLLTLLIPLAATLVAACSSPPHELPTRGESKLLTVQLPTDVVYRKVVEGARTCYARREIAADYFTDNKVGRVSMSVKTNFNIVSLFMAEIRPSDQGSTVQVYFLKGNPVFAEAVEQWALGNYSVCPFA
jgi:hypothetical protein